MAAHPRIAPSTAASAATPSRQSSQPRSAARTASAPRPGKRLRPASRNAGRPSLHRPQARMRPARVADSGPIRVPPTPFGVARSMLPEGSDRVKYVPISGCSSATHAESRSPPPARRSFRARRRRSRRSTTCRPRPARGPAGRRTACTRAGLSSQPIRTSPLVVAMSESHRLADRDELTVEDVLDETFPGVVDWCDPGWLGYWGLDSYRGGAGAAHRRRCGHPRGGRLDCRLRTRHHHGARDRRGPVRPPGHPGDPTRRRRSGPAHAGVAGGRRDAAGGGSRDPGSRSLRAGGRTHRPHRRARNPSPGR